MRRFIFVLIQFITTSAIGQTYFPNGYLFGYDPTIEFVLEQEKKQRMQNVYEQSKRPVSYVVPGLVSTKGEGDKITYNENYLKEREEKRGKRPDVGNSQYNLGKSITQAGDEGNQIYSNSNKKSLPSMDQKIIPYDKSMDPFINGALGYNPNMSLEQNKKWYNQNGYNISYKVRDSTILISGIIAILVVIVIYKLSKRELKDEKLVNSTESNSNPIMKENLIPQIPFQGKYTVLNIDFMKEENNSPITKSVQFVEFEGGVIKFLYSHGSLNLNYDSVTVHDVDQLTYYSLIKDEIVFAVISGGLNPEYNLPTLVLTDRNGEVQSVFSLYKSSIFNNWKFQ